ncbi:MAG: SDR family NAD(P)-dependent oxidoreductase [Rhodococcus sp.]|nr:SDR family NAD(P)-dependent oxidoreductase [Rhodococcus sp. (in: high G+C Gram-positive bacteria)]
MSLSSGVPRLVDAVLDRAVVPGYSRLGIALRRGFWADDDPRGGALAGKTAMVTGANSGIGKATAEALARLGATVLLTVRNRERGEKARDEILDTVPDAQVRVEVCDMSNLGTVRAFAADLVNRVPGIDVLVHNAGVLPEARSETSEAHEITLATHVLGPILLTEALLPILGTSGGARIIFVSSGGMYTQSIPVDDLEYRQGDYRGAVAYARTKRMQVALTPILARRWAAQNASVYSMHPGWVATPGVAASLPGFQRLTAPILRTPADGADTIVWLAATARAPESGLFYHDRRPRTEHYLPHRRDDESAVRQLWTFCADAAEISPNRS